MLEKNTSSSQSCQSTWQSSLVCLIWRRIISFVESSFLCGLFLNIFLMIQWCFWRQIFFIKQHTGTNNSSLSHFQYQSLSVFIILLCIHIVIQLKHFFTNPVSYREIWYLLRLELILALSWMKYCKLFHWKLKRTIMKNIQRLISHSAAWHILKWTKFIIVNLKNAPHSCVMERCVENVVLKGLAVFVISNSFIYWKPSLMTVCYWPINWTSKKKEATSL